MKRYLIELLGWDRNVTRAGLPHERMGLDDDLYREMDGFFFRDSFQSLRKLFESGRVPSLEVNAPRSNLGDIAPMWRSGAFVVSDRLKQFFRDPKWRMPTLEFFPISIVLSKRRSYESVGDGEELEGFWYMNQYERQDIIDLRTSVIVSPTEAERAGSPGHPVISWEKLALSVDPNEDLFAIYRLFCRRFVSQRLALALKENGLKVGLKVVPLDGFSSDYAEVLRRFSHGKEQE